ncbi:MAG: HD domain-containing phosphohydrolase [archaeon]
MYCYPELIKSIENNKDRILAGLPIENFPKYDYSAKNIMKDLLKFAIETDKITGRHMERVGIIAQEFNRTLGGKEGLENILLPAKIHDIGKVYLPKSFFNNNDGLTKKELKEVERHPVSGHAILEYIRRAANLESDRQLRIASDIAFSHHERYNGKGYPRKIAGEKIPHYARLVLIVDIFDAIASKRRYKEAIPYDKTKKIMTFGDHKTNPRQFDPNMIKVFLENFDTFVDIHKTLRNGSLSDKH